MIILAALHKYRIVQYLNVFASLVLANKFEIYFHSRRSHLKKPRGVN